MFLTDANVTMKEKHTLSRSSGCVQHAAPALPNPPKYHLATIFVFCCDDSDAIVTAYILTNTAHIEHTAHDTDQDKQHLFYYELKLNMNDTCVTRKCAFKYIANKHLN